MSIINNSHTRSQIKTLALAMFTSTSVVTSVVTSVTASVTASIVISFPRPAVASALQTATTACQERAAADLPDLEIQVIPTLALPDGSFNLRWQTSIEQREHEGIHGTCRATADGELIEFVNWYAVPRGQRPIESVAAFETDDYTVRIVRLSEQLYMDVYNKRNSRQELSRVPVRWEDSEDGTIYSNLLGHMVYQATLAPDGEYRLLINFGDRTLYDEVGSALNSQPLNPQLLINP